MNLIEIDSNWEQDEEPTRPMPWDEILGVMLAEDRATLEQLPEDRDDEEEEP